MSESQCPKCGAAEQYANRLLTQFLCDSQADTKSGIIEKQSNKCRIAELTRDLQAAREENERLTEAIRRAGFGVCQTSGNWTIHDISEHGKAEEKRTMEVINENVELTMQLADRDRQITNLESAFAQLRKDYESNRQAVIDRDRQIEDAVRLLRNCKARCVFKSGIDYNEVQAFLDAQNSEQEKE